MQDNLKQERQKRMRELARSIGKMSLEQRVELSRRMPTAIATIEGRALSLFNSCMLAMQCPSATVVGGFRQWIKAGRAVRKGEHGHAIWCQTRPKKAEEGEESSEETRFILGTVFDVAQTDPLDKPLDALGYAARVEALEREGLTTSDAQSAADVEFARVQS